MDLNAIGFNYNWIEGLGRFESELRSVRKNKHESAIEKSKPQEKQTSVENKEKGRVVDVSF